MQMHQVFAKTISLGRFENPDTDTWIALWSNLTACTNEVTRTVGRLGDGERLYEFAHPDEVTERLASMPATLRHNLITVYDAPTRLEIAVRAKWLTPDLAKLRHDAVLVVTVEGPSPQVVEAVEHNITGFMRYIPRIDAAPRWPAAVIATLGAAFGLGFAGITTDYDTAKTIALVLGGAIGAWSLAWAASLRFGDADWPVHNPYSDLPDWKSVGRNRLAEEIATACRRT